MIEIENIEIHAAHACDHSCEQCTHFSNYHFGGVLSLADADEQMGYWSHRLQPEWFSILGGEPTLHPQFADFVELACLHWPKVRIVTNGSFLHRHPRLPIVLEANQVLLEVSAHHAGPEYMRRFETIKKLLDDWQTGYRFPINIRNSYRSWERIYRGKPPEMLPYSDADPAQSWRSCRSKWCPQIHDGKLYKCPQIAYLPMVDARFGLGPNWHPYLDYRPLEPGCTDEELQEFVTRTVESICSMCPASPEVFELPDPLPHARRSVPG